MRILNNPNPKEEKTLTCEKCGCNFAYLPGDLPQFNAGTVFEDGKFRRIACPNCGNVKP